MAQRIRMSWSDIAGGPQDEGTTLLTHGHFDHVGALGELAGGWKAPVYAHLLEMPYLAGAASYPPPDPTVGGGLTALLSPLFPAEDGSAYR